MGWERRGKSGKLVYYQSRRGPDGRVTKRYVGVAPLAEMIAAHVKAERARADADRRAVGDEVGRLAKADALAAEVATAAAAMADAVLTSAGWRRTNYGPWRRKRDGPGSPPAGAAGRDPGGDRPGPRG